MRRILRTASTMGALTLAATALTGAAAAATTDDGAAACVAPAPMSFTMDYIDTSRAGGEPIMTRHPDGQLLWGSHAGTTHFYSPTAASPETSAFVEEYEGQTYYYVTDDGEAWDFVPRTPVDASPTSGLPNTGFSDPEFAIDEDGTVYISEINLANIAVSRSTDGGRTYELVNALAFTSSDRQWMAADRGGELYMAANGFGGGSFPADAVGNVGHFIAKSTDGGLTWGAASTTNPNGEADIQVDQDRGILYELASSGGTLEMARFPKIREETTDFTVERFPIVSGVSVQDPTFDMDAAGNLYASWYDPGSDLGRGVFFSASTDQGATWSAPVRVDADARDDVWPWIAVGAPGQVAITWLQSDFETTSDRPGEAGGTEARWDVMVAHSDSGLGCVDGTPARFTATTASSEPVHTGTICQHGTVCQADLTDRRLGDYHSVEVGADGRVHVAVSDTRQGGAVALPLHLRQVDGPLLGDPEAAPTGVPTEEAAATAPDVDPTPTGTLVTAATRALPNTGGGAGLAAIGALGLAAVARTARRRDDA